MSIETLKQELENLDENRRGEMIAFLLGINDRADAEARAELARKIDDKDPSHWMTLEDLERRFREKGIEPE